MMLAASAALLGERLAMGELDDAGVPPASVPPW